MNSMAADVTMFTDDSVRCDGPIVSGPSIWDWAQDLREDRLPGEDADLGPELAAELRALTAATFPSRRLQSAYLGWVLRHVHRRPACRGPGARPPQCRATGLTDDGGGPARPPRRWRDPARRRRRPRLRAPRRHPDRRELDLAARAAAAGLRYLPPEQTTDTDLVGHRNRVSR